LRRVALTMHMQFVCIFAFRSIGAESNLAPACFHATVATLLSFSGESQRLDQSVSRANNSESFATTTRRVVRQCRSISQIVGGDLVVLCHGRTAEIAESDWFSSVQPCPALLKHYKPCFRRLCGKMGVV
jgi:hypothetical protein